ncbi:hypothetical protein QRD02_11780 [Aequorivita sp. SDUM287046]|uniref:Uncharacterized protein n=1 Tax=Aequorivita aurantiaca TaxID=3053356 RepID=A0ABT8DI46_9FLAO|nr:hypothetical protein [Aequorivita aurantiaca]MDN3725066.1 hypothetical protein [Aequorivita aurantiaca]
MNQFTLRCNNNDFISIELTDVFGFPKETSHWGGYDAKGIIQMKAGGYSVKSDFYLSTGNIYNFFRQFEKAHKQLEGDAVFETYEKNLTIKMSFSKTGKVEIDGKFQQYHHLNNKLIFELFTDQSYLAATISELSKIVNQYGNSNGI